jgi:hypothetical protein
MLWNFFQEVDESDSNATGEASQSKKIGADPFNNNEADPAKSGAMRKYLYFIIPNGCYLILFFFFSYFPLQSLVTSRHLKNHSLRLSYNTFNPQACLFNLMVRLRISR